ncbi:MAG TPA: hypothetical protein GX396_04650 [Tissierellia bacterium]|nr:hypothetical protein [Tissierellia bacterium]
MRKLLPFFCIALLLTTCIFGVLYFLSSKNNTEIVEEIIDKTTVLRSSVESGIITSKLEVDGNVIGDSPDIYMDSITVEFTVDSDKSSFETDYKIGDILKKDSFLYRFRKRSTK